MAARIGWVVLLANKLCDVPATLTGQVILAGIGLILLLVPLAILLRSVVFQRYGRELTYRTEMGRISVSLLAVEEALARLLEHERSVRKAHVRVSEDRVRGVLVIEAVLVLWEDPDITGQNQRFQELMHRRFTELMPEHKVEIDLRVHHLHPRTPGILAQTRTGSESRPDRLALPGLAATSGSTDQEAGAALLARARTETAGPVEIAPTSSAGTTSAFLSERQDVRSASPAPAPVPTPVPIPAPRSEPQDFADLYAGPRYPVGDEDEEK